MTLSPEEPGGAAAGDDPARSGPSPARAGRSRAPAGRGDGGDPADAVEQLLALRSDLDALLADVGTPPAPTRRLEVDEDKLEQGLAHLVLTVVEVLRQLMERQALRRVEAGSLTDEEVERLGRTFLALEARMREMCAAFDLTIEDLNLDLGPLGRAL